jgi:hypothetical protein
MPELLGKPDDASWHGTCTAVERKMRRVSIHLLVVVCFVVGAAAVVDAVVVTDRERMDAFIDSVTGGVSEARVDGALRYADPSKVPIDLVHNGQSRRYTDRNASRLKSDARKALATLEGSNLDLIQESISLDGERARIALRLRTQAGLSNAVFDLRRADDRWLLRRVIVN